MSVTGACFSLFVLFCSSSCRWVWVLLFVARTEAFASLAALSFSLTAAAEAAAAVEYSLQITLLMS